MRYLVTCYLTIFLSSGAIAQNKIFTETDEIGATVLEITNEKIKYKRTDNPGPVYSISTKKARLLFNEHGGFLLPQLLDSISNDLLPVAVAAFTNYRSDANDTLDKVYTTQHKLLKCQVLGEEDKTIKVLLNEIELQLDKSSIALIIYKTNKHRLFSQLGVVSDVLHQPFRQRMSEELAKAKSSSQSLAINKVAKDIPPKEKQRTTIPATTPLQASMVPVSTGSASIPIVTAGNRPSDSKPQANDAAKVAAKEKAALAAIEKAKQDSLNAVNALARAEEKRRTDSLASVLAELKKLKADSLAKAQAEFRRYSNTMASALSLLNEKKYAEAREQYILAAGIKPDEQEPATRIASIDKTLQQLAVEIALANRYDSLVAIADSGIASSNWNIALVHYSLASEIKPEEYYLKKQLSFVKKEIEVQEAEEKAKEEARIKKERKDKYDGAMKRADQALKEKKYEVALEEFNEALKINPNDEYAKAKVEALTYQLNKQKENAEKHK